MKGHAIKKLLLFEHTVSYLRSLRSALFFLFHASQIPGWAFDINRVIINFALDKNILVSMFGVPCPKGNDSFKSETRQIYLKVKLDSGLSNAAGNEKKPSEEPFPQLDLMSDRTVTKFASLTGKLLSEPLKSFSNPPLKSLQAPHNYQIIIKTLKDLI